MKISNLTRILPALLAAFFLSVCTPPQEIFRHSDFLGDYSDFKPLKNARGAEGYAKPDLDLSGYDRIVVDPVTLMVDRDAVEGNLTQADLQYLAESFHQALVSELGQSFTIMDRPGPGVLRLRTALTEVISEGTVGMVSGPGARQNRPRLAPEGEQPEIEVPVSGAAMEMELLDSATSERLAAIVDRKGRDLSSGASPREALDEIFSYWADLTEEILVSLRSRGAR